MPWSAGSFTRTNGVHTGAQAWTEDAAAGTKIVASRHDTHDEDLADGINQCVNKDGSNAASIVTTSWLVDESVTEAKLAPDAATRSTTLLTSIATVAPGSAAAAAMVRLTSDMNVIVFTAPKAGKITHLTAAWDTLSVQTGGAVYINIYKNGAEVDVMPLTSGSAKYFALVTPRSFVAGDVLALYVTTDAYTKSGGSGYLIVDALGHYIA